MDTKYLFSWSPLFTSFSLETLGEEKQWHTSLCDSSEKWQREYKPTCHQYGAYYHSRGKGECPFRYRLSHLVTQRSQWQSGFEGKSWIHMVELRASGTLVKLTDLYSQYIYFEQSLAKLLRLALNLPYSWLSFPSSCVTCLHARDWFVIFLFP